MDLALSSDGGSLAFDIFRDTNQLRVYAYDIPSGGLEFVSRASGADGTPAENSSEPDIAADGRRVVFSSADNALDREPNGCVDVFLRNRDAVSTTMVSSLPDGRHLRGADTANQPAISANGRFVAFWVSSRTSNVSGAGDDAGADVFVHDAETDQTSLISRASGASGEPAAGDGPGLDATDYAGWRGANDPAISADGRFVSFSASSTNLSDADADAAVDVVVRDLVAGTTTLVSRASGANGVGGNGHSADPAISADGRYVAFESEATNLIDGDSDGVRDVFVRDLQTGETTLISRASGADGALAAPATVDGGSSASGDPAISADGRFVAFASRADNFSPRDQDLWESDIFVRDTVTDVTALVSLPATEVPRGRRIWSSEPDISADGRIVAYHASESKSGAEDRDRILLQELWGTRGGLRDERLFSAPTGDLDDPVLGRIRRTRMRHGRIRYSVLLRAGSAPVRFSVKLGLPSRRDRVLSRGTVRPERTRRIAVTLRALGGTLKVTARSKAGTVMRTAKVPHRRKR